ncbi:hypothetical protein ElyMa_006425000 [Elysia marginata]|uniref:Uncharacterized protein n=1 Tax=Elysia marginata TaxID=1093978 RepID=A0AAV4HTS5_9GAST|nr:hypothetical protein ElyMa_006425000 [Elysia marginata]
MAGRSGGSAGSGDFPTDYIDIVNEINDFIASLDAPPLSEHTKQLVGDQGKTRAHPRPVSPSHSPAARGDTSGQKPRGFGVSGHGDLEEHRSTPKFPHQRQLRENFGYHDNVSTSSQHLSAQSPQELEDQTASFGNYDNPALLMAKAPTRDVSRLTAESGSRSRHASGEKRQAGSAESRETNAQRSAGQSSWSTSSLEDCDRERNPRHVIEGNVTQPFPSDDDLDQSLGHYDYVDSDRSRSTGFGDYSDSSSYSDTASVTSSSGGGTGDSDSGCYSHYQQPRSQPAPKPSFYKDFSHSIDSSHFLPSPSSPFFSGYKSSGLGNPSLALSRQQQQPLRTVFSSHRPQSPDRLSAEFRCDSDDLSFQRVGSSARTLASHHHQRQQEQALYQQVSSPPRPLPASVHLSRTPQVPKSPVPHRRSPSRILASRADSSPSPTDPIAASSPDPARGLNYSVIQKSEQSVPQNPPQGPQKLNLKARWPPVSSSEDTTATSLGVKPTSVPGTHQPIQLSKPKPFQRPTRDPTSGGTQGVSAHSNFQCHPSSPQHQAPANTRVPDLSVLISELRSAAAGSRLEQASSPTSPYKSTARSESRSHTQSPVLAQVRSEPQSPVTKPRSPAHHAEHQQQQQHQKVGSRSAGQSPVRLQTSGTKPESPDLQQGQKGNSLSPRSRGDPRTDGLRYKSASPDHDYEPIETLQVRVRRVASYMRHSQKLVHEIWTLR